MQSDVASGSPSQPTTAVASTGNQRLAADLFQTFRDMSFDGVGISRETYGPGETAAMQVVEQLAARHGFETTWDAARNFVVRLPGRDPPRPGGGGLLL